MPFSSQGPRMVLWVVVLSLVACNDLSEVGFGNGSGGSAREWQAQELGLTHTLNISDVFFVDERRGWLVGQAPVYNGQSWHSAIYRTDDRGASWHLQASDTNVGIYTAHFVDENTGWVAGTRAGAGTSGPAILHTNNGGASWVAQSLPNVDGVIHGLAFSDGQNGYAVGGQVNAAADDTYFILRTSNGGITWNTVRSGSGFRLLTVFLATENVAVAAGELSGREYLRTVDGGTNWQQHDLDVVPLTGGAQVWKAGWFVDATHGWMVGGDAVLHTQDAGETWTVQRRGGAVVVEDVFFLDRNTGWFVGEISDQQERVYFTNDGGESWTWEFTTVSGDAGRTGLLAVHGTALDNVWAGGRNNTLLRRDS